MIASLVKDSLRTPGQSADVHLVPLFAPIRLAVRQCVPSCHSLQLLTDDYCGDFLAEMTVQCFYE